MIDGVNPRTFLLDGDEIRLPKGGTPPPGLKEGMRFKGKGVRLDDRSIELKARSSPPSTRAKRRSSWRRRARLAFVTIWFVYLVRG